MIFMAIAAMTAGCGGGQAGKETPANDTTKIAVADSFATVAGETVQKTLPLPESGGMRTMGKVVAEHFADLSFETALPIERVLVHNGQQVRRGQVLAQLNLFKLRNDVAKQERAKAKIGRASCRDRV